jgi:hypothetical protein
MLSVVMLNADYLDCLCLILFQNLISISILDSSTGNHTILQVTLVA